MKLIPVIDLKGAVVVTAQLGKRADYAASDSPLCRSGEPRSVLSALLGLYPFDTLYIADIDAISGDGSNLELIRSLHLDHPGIKLWVDNGLTDLDRLCEFARPVIGSESLTPHRITRLLDTLPSPVLSLDFHGQSFIGPAGLNLQPEHWTDEVIVMSLSRVGSTLGPDFNLLRRLSKKSPARSFFAAGGVRDRSDLERLQSCGAAGALLSTALHQGRIGSTALRHFSGS